MMRLLLPEAGPVESAERLEELYLPPAEVHLRVNFVTSLDGVVEIGGRSGPLGATADRQAFMAMRSVADVVVVGSGTANAEHYRPVRLEAEAQARRTRRGQPALPRLAVVSGKGSLDVEAAMFGGETRVIVLTTEQVVRSRSDLAAVAELVPCGEFQVDAGLAVAELRARGLGRILCEGGPTLTASLLSVGLVDELCLTIAPLLAGVGHRSLGDGWTGAPLPFHLAALIEGDGLLLSRYVKVNR